MTVDTTQVDTLVTMEEADRPTPDPLPSVGGSEIVTIIEPSRGWISLKLKELWEYRDLLGFLAWRDISVRYKLQANRSRRRLGHHSALFLHGSL